MWTTNQLFIAYAIGNFSGIAMLLIAIITALSV